MSWEQAITNASEAKKLAEEKANDKRRYALWCSAHQFAAIAPRPLAHSWTDSPWNSLAVRLQHHFAVAQCGSMPDLFQDLCTTCNRSLNDKDHWFHAVLVVDAEGNRIDDWKLPEVNDDATARPDDTA